MSWVEEVHDWEYWLKKYIELVGTNTNFWKGRYYEELFRQTFLMDNPRWNIEYVTLTSPILHFHEVQSCYETNNVIPINYAKLTIFARLDNIEMKMKSWLHIYLQQANKWVSTPVKNLLGKDFEVDEIKRTAKFGEGKLRKRFLLPIELFNETALTSKEWIYRI